MSATGPSLYLPARQIPTPTSVSPEAQAVLAMPSPAAPVYPPADDLDAWREMIAAYDDTIAAKLATRVANADLQAQQVDLGEFRVYDVTPLNGAHDGPIYLDIHGGAFIYGSGDTCRAMTMGTAARLGVRVWGVDYRMAPDHPFPAALEDCVAAYRALLEHHAPERIVVGGASAGGNLAAALLLRARDEGLPLPAAAVLMTPAVDLTCSGDSWHTNRGLDSLLNGDEQSAFLLHAGGADLTDPYLSPLYADFTKGFPPTILTAGTRDLLLSDTVRMHRALRRAGVAADLHVTEAAGHGGFLGMAPEDHEITDEIRKFIEAHTAVLAAT